MVPRVPGTQSVRAPRDLPDRYHREVPTPPLAIQVFGLEGDRATRASLRFFKERRVPVSFVDLRRRPIAPGELRRFVERLGAAALAATESRAWRDAGLGYLRMTDDELVGRLLADVRLLRLPLIRNGNQFSAGPADATWKAWLLETA
jgi:arsenate reductase (glutaredoxin)